MVYEELGQISKVAKPGLGSVQMQMQTTLSNSFVNIKVADDLMALSLHQSN